MPDLSAVCFLHHSLQIIKWDKNTFFSLTFNLLFKLYLPTKTTSRLSWRHQETTNYKYPITTNAANTTAKKSFKMLTTELKTQPGSSDTYSGEQNKLDLATANAQHLSISDGFRVGLHEPQR